MKKYILLLFIIHYSLAIFSQKKVYVRMIDTSGWGNNFADTASINALSLSLYDRLADTSAAVRSALVDTASAIRGALPALEESQAIIDTASAIRSTIAALPTTNLYTADGTISDAVRNVTLGSNDINFDANTLFIDGSANRVGIGTASPDYNLEVESSGNTVISVSSTNRSQIRMYSTNAFSEYDYVILSHRGDLGDWLASYYDHSLNAWNELMNYNSGSDKMVIGNGMAGVGIGATPLSKFDVEGSVSIGASYSGSIAAPTNGLIVQGATGIGTSSVSTHQLNVVGTAGLSTGTAWTNTSDMRLKDVRGRYTAGLEAISRIDPIIFSYKEKNPKGLPSDFVRTGYSAQQVQALIPMAVTEDEQGYLQLNTDPMIAAMINAIRELKEQNEALIKRIEILEKK